MPSVPPPLRTLWYTSQVFIVLTVILAVFWILLEGDLLTDIGPLKEILLALGIATAIVWFVLQIVIRKRLGTT